MSNLFEEQQKKVSETMKELKEEFEKRNVMRPGGQIEQGNRSTGIDNSPSGVNSQGDFNMVVPNHQKQSVSRSLDLGTMLNCGYLPSRLPTEMRIDLYPSTSCQREFIDKIKTNREFTKILIEENDEKVIQALKINLNNMPPFYPHIALPQNESLPLNDIPSNLFSLAEYIAAEYQWDITSVVLLIISMLIVSLGGRYKVKIDHNWYEAVVIYFVLVKESGKMKSSLLELFTSGLDVADKLIKQSSSTEIDKNNIANEETKKIIDAYMKIERKKYLKNITDNDNISAQENWDEVINKMVIKRQELNKKLKPSRVPPQLKVNDATESGLRNLLYEQGGRLTACSSEGAFLQKLNDGRIKDYKLILHANNMEEYIYRAGNSKTSMLFSNPAMNLISMTQPITIEQLYQKSELIESGLLPRIQVLFGSNYQWSGRQIIDKEEYNIILKRLTDIICEKAVSNFSQDHDIKIYEMSIDDEAKSILNDFCKQNDIDIKSGQYQYMEAYLEKSRGTAVRLAAGIHVWNAGDTISTPISASEMRAGVTLAKILCRHARYLYDMNANKETMKLINRTLKVIISHKLECFTASKITHELNRVNIEKLRPILDILIKHYCLNQYIKHNNQPVYITNTAIFDWMIP
jgi:hypothetical protein